MLGGAGAVGELDFGLVTFDLDFLDADDFGIGGATLHIGELEGAGHTGLGPHRTVGVILDDELAFLLTLEIGLDSVALHADIE